MNYLQFLIEEKDKLKGSITEILFGRIKGKVIVDREQKLMIIKGINYNKFLHRIRNMLETNKINKLFDKKYTKFSELMWRKKVISSNERKISQLEVPLFFSLEMYNLFMELSDFYNLKFYKAVAKKIYDQTWISNYDKKDMMNLETTKSEYLSKLKFEAKDYQKEFILNYKKLKYIYDLEGYILSFDQGLGKTFTSVALAEVLSKDKIIIVCPNSLKENWAYEIKSYYSKYNNEKVWKDEIFILGSSKFNNFSNKTKYVIVNQESIPKIYNIVRKFNNPMIIVDESHNFRNMNGKRTKELLELKKITNCKDNLLMSGTPIKATPNEIIPALLMIDPYFTMELAEIYNRTFNIDKPGVSAIVKARLDRDIYRKTKQEVLKLPNKYIEIVRLKITNPEPYIYSNLQNQINIRYHEIYDELIVDNKELSEEFRRIVIKYSSASPKETKRYLKFIIDTTNTGKNVNIHDYDRYVFDNFLKNNVYPNIKNPEELKYAKEIKSKYINMIEIAIGRALGEILPPARNNCYKEIFKCNKYYFIDMINKNLKKTIIFTPFVEVCEYVYNELKKEKIGCVKIDGKTNERMDLIQQFKFDDTIDVLIATTQTLSTGVTLTEATQMFFLGTPWRSADYNQATDRIYRIGQTQDVYIYNILLDSEQKNITDRIQQSVDWSEEMFNSII